MWTRWGSVSRPRFLFGGAKYSQVELDRAQIAVGAGARKSQLLPPSFFFCRRRLVVFLPSSAPRRRRVNRAGGVGLESSEKMIPVPHFFRLVAFRVAGESGCVGV